MRQILAALEDEAALRHHRIEALLPRQRGVFHNAVERLLARPPEDRKRRLVASKIQRVVAPFTGGDLAAIDIENGIKFPAVEGNLPATPLDCALASSPSGRGPEPRDRNGTIGS